MIRKLMQSIREFKLFSLLSPLFVVLEVVMEVVIPILMAKLIDDGIDGSGGMDRFCTESAARYVLPRTGLLVFQYR